MFTIGDLIGLMFIMTYVSAILTMPALLFGMIAEDLSTVIKSLINRSFYKMLIVGYAIEVMLMISLFIFLNVLS